MKFRKLRPSIAASIGRMMALSIPKRPDANPERKAVAASTHSSAVIPVALPRLAGRRDATPPVDAGQIIVRRSEPKQVGQR